MKLKENYEKRVPCQHQERVKSELQCQAQVIDKGKISFETSFRLKIERNENFISRNKCQKYIIYYEKDFRIKDCYEKTFHFDDPCC